MDANGIRWGKFLTKQLINIGTRLNDLPSIMNACHGFAFIVWLSNMNIGTA